MADRCPRRRPGDGMATANLMAGQCTDGGTLCRTRGFILVRGGRGARGNPFIIIARIM